MRVRDIVQHLNKFPKKKALVLEALGVGVSKPQPKPKKGKKQEEV